MSTMLHVLTADLTDSREFSEEEIALRVNAHDELVAALRALLPYAENETQGLWACVRDDDAIADEANAAEEALTAAYAALAKASK